MKKFDDWNRLKKHIESLPGILSPHIREIWHCHLGKNIGFEQDGKGEHFVRPVVIVKKFNRRSFLGIPLSTTNKQGKYYHHFSFRNNQDSVAIISQIRFLDSKRLIRKIGMIPNNDFLIICKKISALLN